MTCMCVRRIDVMCYFPPSIYFFAVQIDLRGWPLLPEHLPKHVARRLIVRDVMATPPCFVEEVARVGEVLDMLHSTKHNGFPVS